MSSARRNDRKALQTDRDHASSFAAEKGTPNSASLYCQAGCDITRFPPVVHDLAPDYLRWMVIPEEMRSRFWSLPARLGSRVYP